MRRLLFPLGALVGLALAAVALFTIAAPAEQQVLPLGLPDLPFHLRRDALSNVFLFLLGAASAGISLFGAGYFRTGEGSPPGLLCLQYHVFLASMGFVLLADDAYAFMVSWETMALSSYFLVTTQHRIPEIRSAGFLYLLIAHLGAICDPAGFGVLQGGSWQFTFDAMRGAALSPPWAAVAFCLALLGFGAKAGLVPLHVWLPEAHPAAPSPVSALMSGVMLKTALYGLLRVTFDLLGNPAWWWGLIPLALGLFTAIYGVVFAAAQTDMKRLLAFSSIENIGIMFTGVGLAIVFRGVGMNSLAALALIAVLYHAVNHAFMKSLLFLATGSVLHATGQRNLGRLGGLIHRMPWVAWLTLIGVLAIAGSAAAQRFRVRVAVATGLSLGARSPADLCQHAAAARCGGDRARGGPRRLRHGEVLRRGVPRAAARSGARRCPRCGLVGARRARVAGVRLRRAGSAALTGGRPARHRHPSSSAVAATTTSIELVACSFR